MSFLSILKSVGKVAKVAAPAIGAGISAFNPAAGALFNGVVSAMGKAEQAYDDVPKSGPQKKTFAVAEFEAGLSLAAEILAIRGEELHYDRDALHRYIDAQTAAFNALADLKKSFEMKPAAMPDVPSVQVVHAGGA